MLVVEKKLIFWKLEKTRLLNYYQNTSNCLTHKTKKIIMVNKIIIPSAGQITDDFKIIKLFIQIGQEINEGDIVAEIETDKSTMELESFCSGKISKILVKEGDVVETGHTIAIVK